MYFIQTTKTKSGTRPLNSPHHLVNELQITPANYHINQSVSRDINLSVVCLCRPGAWEPLPQGCPTGRARPLAISELMP